MPKRISQVQNEKILLLNNLLPTSATNTVILLCLPIPEGYVNIKLYIKFFTKFIQSI